MGITRPSLNIYTLTYRVWYFDGDRSYRMVYYSLLYVLMHVTHDRYGWEDWDMWREKTKRFESIIIQVLIDQLGKDRGPNITRSADDRL